MTSKTVSIVVPVYNEESNILPIYQELVSVFSTLKYNLELLFVDDGSGDKSLSIVKELAGSDTRVYYIELSKNFGQQYALKAGMDLANGDCVISMDCDLQHPPSLIRQLIEKWEAGYDVVYTRRNYEKKLPWLKRKSSMAYYDLLNSMSDIHLEYGVADFRLLDRKVVNVLSDHAESGLFLRGLVRWVGFRQIGIEYKANDRFRGNSKYSVRRMLAFGLEGVLAFSTKPLVIITYIGLALLAFAVLAGFGLLVAYMLGNALSDTILILWGIMFFCSLQMFIIGIICLYVSKLVVESRHRPPYLIRETNYPTERVS